MHQIYEAYNLVNTAWIHVRRSDQHERGTAKFRFKNRPHGKNSVPHIIIKNVKLETAAVTCVIACTATELNLGAMVVLTLKPKF